MKTIEEFVKEWSNGKNNLHIRGVRTKSSTTYGNHFTIDESEYDNSYFIALFIVKDKQLIDTGYICLEDILGVFDINE